MDTIDAPIKYTINNGEGKPTNSGVYRRIATKSDWNIGVNFRLTLKIPPVRYNKINYIVLEQFFWRRLV